MRAPVQPGDVMAAQARRIRLPIVMPGASRAPCIDETKRMAQPLEAPSCNPSRLDRNQEWGPAILDGYRPPGKDLVTRKAILKLGTTSSVSVPSLRCGGTAIARTLAALPEAAAIALCLFGTAVAANSPRLNLRHAAAAAPTGGPQEMSA